MSIEIKEVPGVRVVAMRHVGPYPKIGQLFGKLSNWGAEHNVPIQGAMSIFYSDTQTVAPEELQSDACLIVPAGYCTEGDEVTAFDVPAQKSAVYVYIGSYDGLPEAWGKFGAEIHNSDHTLNPKGLWFERYDSDMRTTPPEKLETSLYIPVE